MKKQDFDRLKTRLTEQVIENPLLSVGVFAAAATAASKLLDASTERKRARTWDREVAKREYQTYNKRPK